MTTTSPAIDASRDDRLVEALCRAAAAEPGSAETAVREHVRRLAPLADALERERLVDAAVARLDGLGPLDSLIRDRSVDEVLVNAGGEIWVERAGRPGTPGIDCRGRPRGRDRADPRTARSSARSHHTDCRRPPQRRDPRLRGGPPSQRRRHDPVAATLPQRTAPADGLRRRGRHRSARRTRRATLQHGHLRRHVNRQDIAALQLARPHRSRRAHRAARGHGGVGPARRASRSPRSPAGDHRRRGSDLGRTAPAHRVAVTTRPSRRRRSAWSRSARPRPGAEHRSRRFVVDLPRQQRPGRPASSRDARGPGRSGMAATGDPRPPHSVHRCHRPRRAHHRAGTTSQRDRRGRRSRRSAGNTSDRHRRRARGHASPIEEASSGDVCRHARCRHGHVTRRCRVGDPAGRRVRPLPRHPADVLTPRPKIAPTPGPPVGGTTAR